MVESSFIHLLIRIRPRFGWLPFALMVGVLACLVFSVLEVEWVPDDRVVILAVTAGLISASLLAHRSIRPALAWGILITLGIGLVFVFTAELWPPLRVLRGGVAAVADFWHIRLAFFTDRASGWLAAVRGGGRSTETIVFTLSLAIAGWFVAALLAWSAYRSRRAYLGLTMAGFALAANTFYGQAGLYWVVLFFGLAITLGTYLNYLYREIEWDRNGTDYSAEVRTDLIVYTAGVSLGIMSLAMAIPAINFRAIADAFQRQDAVVAAEQTMARAFAGVAQPRSDEGSANPGGMPRSFLLGDDPELTETVVMTATLQTDPPTRATDLDAFHWRSISFDVYTGRGWRRSPEREENVDRGQPIPLPDEPPGRGRIIQIIQKVDWTYDHRASRYTLGRPVVFSHDLVAMWRGLEDLVGVRGRNFAPGRYSAETRLVVATPDQLRGSNPDDIPPEIRARYTALPDTIPARVYDLAREVTGSSEAGSTQQSAYDQALSIEQFLHQYAYSLDLPPLPPEIDVVDYFLFDLQKGFCDYFASAMVVMARAVGLPARLGVGFLQQPENANGVQTIRQIDAHSWAEVYFAGYGWVEFEPTPPFAASPVAGPTPPAAAGEAPTYTPPGGMGVAIPERAPQRETPWLLFLGLGAVALVAWRLWGRRLTERIEDRDANLDDVQLAFARLQDGAAALGHPPQPAQTPAEFAAELLAVPVFDAPENSPLRPLIARLTDLFAVRQYGRTASGPLGREARATWAGLKTPLRRLVWRRRLRRPPH